MAREVKKRNGTMLGAFCGVKKGVLQNAGLNVTLKSLVVSSLLTTQGLCHAGVWPKFDEGRDGKVLCQGDA
eukprot:3587470-Karenia_brevis.AAC.1